MKPVSQIRRERLAQLVLEAGSQVAVADRISKDKNQIYQWLLDPDTRGARNIGPTSARAIETALSKPLGWLDHEDEWFSGSSESSHNHDIWQSCHLRPTLATLVQALKIISTDEALNGVYGWERKAEVLLYLCAKLEAGEDPNVLGMKLTHERQKGGATHGNTTGGGDGSRN